MKYVKNNGRYALAFIIDKNGREVKIELDRRRLYLDTGNIATTGITAVADDDYEILKEVKQFKALLKKGEFELVDEPVNGNDLEALKRENAELKKKLKEDKKPAKADDKELAEKDKEIASLKAQLESLTKKEVKEVKEEEEGF